MRRSGFYGLSVVLVAGLAAACTPEAPAPEPEAPVEAAPEAVPPPEAAPAPDAVPAPDAAPAPEGAAPAGEPNYDILPDGE